jgi:hypothetical protein
VHNHGEAARVIVIWRMACSDLIFRKVGFCLDVMKSLLVRLNPQLYVKNGKTEKSMRTPEKQEWT